MSEYSFQPPSLHELAALMPAYEMVDFLAQGGMGAVYLAKQISLDRLVAIKVLPPSWGTEKGYAQRFQTEARAMAKLRHNHIVGVYDFGITTDGHLYLVMEYVEGQTMHDMIRLRRLPVAKVQDVAVQLCDAIQYAHEHGILHRDLKPGNVMVDKHGQVKVMDFGLARRAEAAVEEESLGTPEYTAPEILVTGALIDHRADIYALGIVFQQMLTGVVPRQPREPLAEHGVFDPAWEPLISKAAATNAGARFQTMRELKEAVASVGRPSAAARSVPGVKRVTGPGPGHGPHSPTYHPTPAPKSSTPIMPMVVILMLIGAGIFWWLKNRDGLGGGDGTSNSGLSTTAVPSTGSGNNAGGSGAASANTTPAGDTTVAGGGATTPAGTPAGAYQLPKDIPAGHVYKFQDGHKDIVNDVVLFPDQHRVATASTDGTIGIWDLHKARRLQTLGPVPGAVLKIAVSPDGKYLAAGGDNYKVLLWKLADLQSEPAKSLDLKVRIVTNLEFSKDGLTVLVGTSDGQQPLVAWTWETGAEEPIPGFRGQVLGLQMLPGAEGNFVAGGTRKDNERWVYDVWYGDLSRRSLVKEFPKPPQGAFRLRIAPDGKTILSLGGGRFQVWDLDAGMRISRQQGGPLSFFRCEFVDGGRLVVGGGQDRALHIFESVTGTEVWKSDPYETRCANAFAISPDGSYLVSAGGFGFGNPMEKDGDYALHVWKLPDLSTLKTEGAAGALAKRDLLELETADPELWNLLGTLHQQWQETVAAKENESNRKDLDEKYLGALRREVVTASPAEKEHFLSEISRVANNGPVPSQRPATWPVSLTRLHDIYVQQLGMLPRQSKEAGTELIAQVRNKLAPLEQQRSRANNAAGAERVRIVMDTMRTLGGEPDREKILQSLRSSASATSNNNSSSSPGNTSAGGTTSSQPTIQPAGMAAPPMTGPSVLRRPVRTGRVAVWKRSSRTDGNANMQWADTAPQIADAVSVSAGTNHALVLRADGTVAALGKKNSTTQATVPSGLDRVVAVAAGNRYDIALREDGSTVVWSTGGVYPLEGVRPAVAVHAGPAWGYARHADGSLTRLPTGNIGNATAYSEPPPGLGAVVDIAVGTDACVALLPDGSLASWGSSNRAGGMATIPEGKGSGVVAITCNNWDAAVLRRDGELAVWGAYPNSPPNYSPKRFPGADRVVRALPSGAFAVHFPGDRWMICNSAGGEIIDASTAEPLANGCFDLGVTSLYCVGIKP